MDNAKELVGVIDLNALNIYNAEQVEDGSSPLSVSEAYRKVEDLVNGYAEDLVERVKSKAYEDIEWFISDNWRSFEGNDLAYADTGKLVDAIANQAKNELF